LNFKLLKDPIYGYVEISSDLISDIIDSACFQRLRNIRQTSYAPLYPASFHNRFLHSVGVFFLGRKAFRSVESTLEKEDQIFDNLQWENIKRVFELSCLLHDVGHAPFSHTGELFFLADSSTPPSIYTKLMSLVENDAFTSDVEFYYNNGKSAAPHEVMSCIVALSTFKDHFSNSFEREFFSRCITGFKYLNISDQKDNILNCLIELLNSPIIDVDRLDYIIRDAQTTGFQSVSIDYERLLDGIRIINKDGVKCLGYHKSALSVIENVIYAHDAERKWIQNHPTILYEHFLLQHSMRSIDKYFSLPEESTRLFSYETLTLDGAAFKDKGKICLLADEDILFIMKNIYSDELVKEYFARNCRRHPIWKSEAEYRALFDNELGKNKLDEFEIAFKEIEKYLIDHFSIPVINDQVLQFIQDEEKNIVEKKNLISNKDYNNLISGIEKIKKWVACLKGISDENGFPFDFAIISANKFKSGFMKKDLEKMLIYFPNLDLKPYIREVSTILSSEKTRDSFFYLFYRKGNNNKDININNVTKVLSAELFK